MKILLHDEWMKNKINRMYEEESSDIDRKINLKAKIIFFVG